MDRIALLAEFLDRHTDCSEDEARAMLRAASTGEDFTLPEASDFASEALRARIVSALAAHVLPEPAAALPAPAASNAASGMTPDARKAVLEAIAPEPAFTGTVSFLAASDMPIEEAAKTLRIAKEQAASAVKATGLPAGYRTIAERAADMPEMGPMHSAPMLDADARKEAVKAGWKKAFAAVADAPALIGGR